MVIWKVLYGLSNNLTFIYSCITLMKLASYIMYTYNNVISHEAPFY